MNTELMFSSKTDLWSTPQEFFDELDAEFGFNLDACAIPENAKCDVYYTPEQDGLFLRWYGTVWCNPPYGREIGKWVAKAAQSAKRGATVVMLLPARTDTKLITFIATISTSSKAHYARRLRSTAAGYGSGTTGTTAQATAYTTTHSLSDS